MQIKKVSDPRSRATVQTCTIEDIRQVHAHLRDADLLELQLVYGDTDVWHLEYTYYLALAAWAIYLDGRAIGVFGVSSMSPLAAFGVPWFVATDELVAIRHIFLRYSKSYIAQVQEFFPRLENYVHCENTVSCAWLRWLGFQFDDPAPHGAKGALFHRFYK